MCLRRLAALLPAVVFLAGCGGGIYIAFGDAGDRPPSVDLAAASASAAPGQPVRLAAVAADDDFVARVDFYRLESDGHATLLGSDAGPPYVWDTPMPSVARGATVRFYAEAVDSSAQRTRSPTVAVTAL